MIKIMASNRNSYHREHKPSRRRRLNCRYLLTEALVRQLRRCRKAIRENESTGSMVQQIVLVHQVKHGLSAKRTS